MTIVVVSLVSFLLTFGAVPIARRLARAQGLYEQPVQDRWHQRPVPKMGGVAMASVFFPLAWHFGNTPALRILTLTSALMFVLGLFDDLHPIRPRTKLVGQVVATAAFLLLTPPLNLTGEPIVDLMLSFLWFVGITNAFNLLDNMDGLAAGIAAIAGSFFVIALLLNGSPEPSGLPVVVGAMTGVSLGFLVHNWHPASIFMGDSGSHLIGSFLAGATLLAAPNIHEGSQVGVTLALLLLLVPCTDTALVILTRHLAGRSAFVGGRDHLSHRMVAAGLHERPAVIVLYALAIAGGVVALGLQNLANPTGWILAGLYGVAVAAVGVYLGRMDLDIGAVGSSRLPIQLASQYRGYTVLFDAVLITAAYYLGLATRFPDSAQFGVFLDRFLRILPLILLLHLGGLWTMGKYRQSRRSTGLSEVRTILKGSLLGSGATVVAVLYLTGFEGYSRQAFAVAGAFAVLFLTGGQVALNSANEFLRRRTRRPMAIIYGAGERGAMAVRELRGSRTLKLAPFGLIDDDRGRRHDRIEGLRVLGTLDDLDAVLRRTARRVTTVIVTVQGLPEDRIDRLCAICERHDVEVRQLNFSLDDVERRDRTLTVVRFPRA